MLKTSLPVFVSAILAIAPAERARPQTPAARVDGSLERAISGVSPLARLLRADDLDRDSCGPPGHDPGIVRADFDGDGHQDYATLLAVPRGGADHGIVQIWLVVFMSDRTGRLTPVVLDRGEHSLPAIVGLAPRAPGAVRETESIGSGRTVTLERPGFSRYYCEKSETVYYWDERRKRFSDVAVSD